VQPTSGYGYDKESSHPHVSSMSNTGSALSSSDAEKSYPIAIGNAGALGVTSGTQGAQGGQVAQGYYPNPVQHAPVYMDPSRVSGIYLRQGLVFPAGDIPRREHGKGLMGLIDLIIVGLLFAGLIVMTAVAEWTATSPGRTGIYFGSMWLVVIGFLGWMTALWLGWRYARESITIGHGARYLWIGMLIGVIVSAVMWGAVIEPLGQQYEQWHLRGARFSARKVAHIVLLNALVLPFIEQGLILLALYWATTRRHIRLWRPYSYVATAVCLAVGAWTVEQVIIYSAFPAWFQTSGGHLSNGLVARGVFGEALFFLFCVSPYFIVAAMLAGASRAVHQLNDRDQVELAHVADLPPELFPGPLAASMLFAMMVFIRGFPEVFHYLVLTQGGQRFDPSKTSITLVYLLIGIIGYMLVRHRMRSTLPTLFLLDPVDYHAWRNRNQPVARAI
jgi:hypothetical protein